MPSNFDHGRSDTASRVINASPDTIYRAFTSAASLMKWLPPSGMSGEALEYDFTEGGRYKIQLRYDERMPNGSGKTTESSDITRGKFLELVPGRRIRQSVEFESSDPAFAGTMTMTWSLEPLQEATMVTVTAANVPRGMSEEDHVAGLRSSIDNLASSVENQH
jgi:uncharacterized protein YndB with AHSA1/START domain